MHRAVRAGYRLDECRKMTVKQLTSIYELEAEISQEQFKSDATAARVASADKRGWQKVMSELDKAAGEKRRKSAQNSKEPEGILIEDDDPLLTEDWD